jgi:hypothetical protein
MRHVKSERLKKLESELSDLEQWLRLGLVPKKDIAKHKEEILGTRAKIEEEKERLQFLKESGEVEEYVTPKRQTTRAGYTEMPTIPDIDMTDTAGGVSESSFEMETSSTAESETSVSEDTEEEATESNEEEEEDSYFSDRNRWRRGGIVDPDADEW